jgi:hypothetical protein
VRGHFAVRIDCRDVTAMSGFCDRAAPDFYERLRLRDVIVLLIIHQLEEDQAKIIDRSSELHSSVLGRVRLEDPGASIRIQIGTGILKVKGQKVKGKSEDTGIATTSSLLPLSLRLESFFYLLAFVFFLAP